MCVEQRTNTQLLERPAFICDIKRVIRQSDLNTACEALKSICRVLNELLNLLPAVPALGDPSLFAGIFLYAVRVLFVDANALVAKIVDHSLQSWIWAGPLPRYHRHTPTARPSKPLFAG